MELFYYQNQKRLGPVNSAQIRALAAAGEITPETIVEAGGKKLPAAKVKGLEFPAPVPPAILSDPEPAPESKTVYSPFGGGTRVQIDPAPLPAMEPASAPDPPYSRELKASASALEKSVKNISQIGWVIVGGWLIEFLICLIAAMNSENPAPFIVGGLLSVIPAGIAASVFFFLGNLGRFLLAWTRFHNSN